MGASFNEHSPTKQEEKTSCEGLVVSSNWVWGAAGASAKPKELRPGARCVHFTFILLSRVRKALFRSGVFSDGETACHCRGEQH